MRPVTPYYFGSSGRRLFGCYHPPVVPGGALGVVLCNPLGREYIAAHRAVRLLARTLAERGIHALRFDYYGTGDSDGSETDVGMDSCVFDVGAAVEELAEVSGVANLGLVGIRAGAEVAVRASRTRGEITRLVLWDPVTHSGQPFAESPGASAHAPPILLVSTRPAPDAYDPIVQALTRAVAAPALIHAPAAPCWSDRGPGSGGLPVAAVRETAEWLSN